MCVHNTHTHLPSTHTHPFSPSQAPSPTGSQKEVRASEKRVWGAAARCGPAAAALTPIAVDPHTQRTGWLAFGSLRSFPAGQLRRLCAALHARAWPLERREVQLLVRQAVYHLGELTDCSAPPQRAWRAGWESAGDVLPTLCSELELLADELQDKPREHEAVLLLGEVRAGWGGALHFFDAPAPLVSHHTSPITTTTTPAAVCLPVGVPCALPQHRAALCRHDLQRRRRAGRRRRRQ